MSGANTFGSRFQLTTFGESHGTALGCVIDGMPAGVKWNEALLLKELERRRPGTSKLVSARGEEDKPELLSGVYQNKTLGTPIALIIRNHDARSEDYRTIATKPRKGHADDMWREKFGHSDPRGGGRSSGRETVCRVIGGAVAQMFINQSAKQIRVKGFTRAVGDLELSDEDLRHFESIKGNYPADRFAARFPSKGQGKALETLLLEAKEQGRSYGGVAELHVDGLPSGLGQPVFRKLKADLASAFMSIGATTSLEIGEGFAAVKAEGSKFHRRNASTQYGGLRGGIATGERLTIRVGFKPTSSVLDVAKKGRHDPCIVPRAVPVLEAMTWLVIADHLLWTRGDRV